jgi:hypothetical protein
MCTVMVRSTPAHCCVAGYTYHGSALSRVLFSLFVGELGTRAVQRGSGVTIVEKLFAICVYGIPLRCDSKS